MSGAPAGRHPGQQYERILDAMGDGVFSLDASGRITHVNDAFLSMAGYEYETLVGSDPTIVHDDADIERFEAVIEEMLGEDPTPTSSVTTQLRPATGEPIPVEVTIRLLTGPDGGFEGTVGVVRDLRERRERERERERAERRFEAVFEDPQLLVGLLSPEGRVLDANRTAMEFIEADRESVLGEYFPETPWWSEGVRDDVTDWIDRAAAGEYVEYDAVLERSDGDTYAVDGVIRPVTDDSGSVRSLIVSAQDVTDRRERERQLERYEVLLTLMPDTVVITDVDGTLQEIHGADGWSGYDPEALIGGHFDQFVTEETVERARDATRRLLSTGGPEKVTYEHISVTADGEEVPFENHITLLPPDEDGVIAGSMSVLRNITEQKQRERQLRQQNERLEEFAQVVSHDLRNPLNVASGHVELLQSEIDRESLDSVEDAHDRMQTVIEDVLALAREGADVEETGPVELERVVRLAWDSVETERATLAVEGDVTIAADRTRLQRLLENLIRNAVDHGGDAVTVTVGPIEADEAGFFVEDDGVGLPATDRQAIFESGHSGIAHGTGFGLAIVERITDAHGWSIDATDSENGGARFDVTGVERS